MSRAIGFSTGALAKGDFRRALAMLGAHQTSAIEFSALRTSELDGLLAFIGKGDFPSFEHVSFHAPSKFDSSEEASVVERLRDNVPAAWPIIVHPDVVTNVDLWRSLGRRLCFENMDERKPIGRSCDEMSEVFRQFPEAAFCFDIGHAHQIDPSMSQAVCLLKKFGQRMRQIHFSEVDADSAHCSVGWLARQAFAEIAPLIDENVPVILEAVIDEAEIENELRVAQEVLGEPAVVS